MNVPQFLFSCPRVILLILGACLLARSFGPARAGEPPTGKEAVKQVLAAQVAAWNKGDLEGFMKGYWNSPELSFFSGKDQRKGWKDTLARYRQRYQAEGRHMGQLRFDELDIQPIGADHVWVRGRWRLDIGKEVVGGLFTLIVKKFPDGWKIIHDHTSG